MLSAVHWLFLLSLTCALCVPRVDLRRIPSVLRHGIQSGRIEALLLSNLKPRTVELYLEVINEFLADIAQYCVDWSLLSEIARDEFLADWIVEHYENDPLGSPYRLPLRSSCLA